MRGKRLKTKLIGTMRTRMTLSCSSRMLRSSCARPVRSFSALQRLRATRRADSSIAWVITSSPTVFMSSSIFSTLTRIEPESPTALMASGFAAGTAVRVGGGGGGGRCGSGFFGSAALSVAGGAALSAGSGACRTRFATGSRRSFRHRATQLEIAVAFGPLEHLFDRVLGDVAGELEFPGEIAALCVEFLEARAARSMSTSTFSSPSSASSRIMRSGSLPRANSSRYGRKEISQVGRTRASAIGRSRATGYGSGRRGQQRPTGAGAAVAAARRFRRRFFSARS